MKSYNSYEIVKLFFLTMKSYDLEVGTGFVLQTGFIYIPKIKTGYKPINRFKLKTDLNNKR